MNTWALPGICCIGIREVQYRDLRDVYEIELTSFGGDSYPYHAILFYYFLSRRYFLVATCLWKVVGYIIGVLEARRVKYGHVISLAIAPLYRRMGLATRLINSLEERFVHDGASRAYLEVKKTNKPAIRLYLKLGYRVTRVLRGYYNGEDGLLMVKKLNNIYHRK